VKANLIISKRWEDNIETKQDSIFACNYSFRSLFTNNKIADHMRFAELLNWPFLAGARPKLIMHIANFTMAPEQVLLYAIGSMDCRYLVNTIALRPCRYLCTLVLRSLILALRHITTRDLCSKKKTFWRITSVLGRA
jgi:hypothetical protein